MLQLVVLQSKQSSLANRRWFHRCVDCMHHPTAVNPPATPLPAAHTHTQPEPAPGQLEEARFKAAPHHGGALHQLHHLGKQVAARRGRHAAADLRRRGPRSGEGGGGVQVSVRACVCTRMCVEKRPKTEGS